MVARQRLWSVAFPVSSSFFPIADTSPGVAHHATKDIVYGPYVIPAGVTVASNHWAIGHDPRVFPDPQHFDPQRCLDGERRVRSDLRSYRLGLGGRYVRGSIWRMRAFR